MTESYADLDLATLRAMARAAGVPGTDQMSHDELVDTLRRAGLADPAGKPIDTQLSDPGDPGPEVYHGKGVGRRETVGGAGAQLGDTTQGASRRNG